MRGDRAATRRWLIVAACVVSLVGACVLAWWQWTRFESASGTWQNLGYVLQWPLFGLFPAFMFWRVKRLKESPGRADRMAPRIPSRLAPVTTPVSVDGDVDDELAAYNRYLAELNTKDQA